MRRAIVLGFTVLLGVVGCGGSSSTPDAGGGTSGGGRAGGGTSGGGTGGGGTAGSGTAGSGTGGGGSAGSGTAGGGTAGGGTSGGGTVGGGTSGGGTSGGGTAGGGTTGGGTSGGGRGGGGTGGGSTGGAGAGGGGTGGAGPRTVTLAVADAVVFTAGQDGSGAWHPLSPLPAFQMWTLDVTGSRYGLAYGCSNAAGDNVTITVVQATVAETTRVTGACGGLSTAPVGMITGTVGGLTDPQAARVDIAGLGQQVAATAPTYSLPVPMGTWDLFARRMTASPMFDRVLRRNSVTVGANTTVNLDFATEGFAPEMRTVTFQGVSATETQGLLVIFRNTLGGSSFGLGSFPSGSYLAIPAAQLRGGDYHSIVAAANDPGGTGRRVRRTYTAAMNFTAVMPPMITPPVIAIGSTTPYLRPRASIPSGLDSDRYDLGYTQSDTAPARTRSWALQLTRGWIAAAAASDYTLPDLAAVGGFQSWWGLATGVTYWQQFANWSNAGVADLLRVDQTVAELDGREYKIVQRDGNATF
jgi:hypothetical protein